MDRLLHTSLSAMRGAMHRQAANANNLANANTPGFRAELSSASALWLNGPGFEARAHSSEEVVSADMHEGAVTETGRPLDVALKGEALLAVQAENGEEAYTRRGDLQLTDSGLVTTGDGRPVLGEGGPLTLPPADKIMIDATGAVWIVPPGGDANAPQQVDRLKLVSPTGSRIAKGMDGLFRVRDGGALPSDPDAKVVSGSIEESNVNPTQALIDMIEQSRSWENQIKLMTTARELDTDSADLMRLPN